MADDSSSNNAEIFVYTEGVEVPRDVVRVRVHQSVTAIPRNAFNRRYKLEEVELCDGLLEIGEEAFKECTALQHINIPSNVTTIGNNAFHTCSKLQEVELCEGLQEIGYEAFERCTSLKNVKIPSVIRIGHHAFSMTPLIDIQLPDGLEEIGNYAFMQWNNQGDYSNSNIPTLRIPALVKTIPMGLITKCGVLFSLELSENVTQIERFSMSCPLLRNIALPTTDINIEERVFEECTDLLRLFNTETNIINTLQHRFDNLPIHKMVYYQAYNNITPDQLNDATEIRISQRRRKLNPAGGQQDCLGMTPLHIMTCSSVQNVELYKVLVVKYPETLIAKDRWGAIPLLYAVWGKASSESIRFLVESYNSIYPDLELNWTNMMVTLGKVVKSWHVIRTLIDVHQEFFPNRLEEWINELAVHDHISEENFRFLVQCRFTERVNAIGLKHYRNKMMKEMEKVPYGFKCTWLGIVRSKLVNYEEEYNMLKEATTILELAMWKREMDESDSKKKRKRAEDSSSDYREQCRVSCGADMVIDQVLPYLLPSSISP